MSPAAGAPRVLFLAESFWPVLGGGEQHIRQLATALVGRGLECTVLTRRGERSWPTEERLAGVRVLRVAPSGPGRVGKYVMALPALLRLMRERDSYDVAVVRGTRVLGLPGLVGARLAHRPVVLQCEVSGEMSGEIYTWGTRYDRRPYTALVRGAVRVRNLLLRGAERFVAISRRTEAEFLAAGLARERVLYLPHGVDTRRFRPATPAERAALRARLGLPADAFLVVFTGRLLEGKGVELLLEAAARLSASSPGVHVVLVGSGAGQALSVEDDLRARAAQPPLAGRVTFTGRVENVEDYLRAADAFGFPSFFEALPLSVIEAAASGLPCATTRIGGIVDVIEHERNGLLVEPGDALGLAGALARLESDQALRARLGAAARETAVSQFDFERHVDRYHELFEELARGSRPHGRR